MWEATADMELNFSLVGCWASPSMPAASSRDQDRRINYWLLILIFLPAWARSPIC